MFSKSYRPSIFLKKPFANDSNTLDTQFYDELLHLLGLEEVIDSGKKNLMRLSTIKRNDGSLLENTIRILKINNSLERIKNPDEFGVNEEEKLFSIGLELCITWLNRILFLKLLESQLIKYNDNDYSFKFLTKEKIKDFDELNELFFEALALKTEDRASQDKERFAKIPYLNSSLFEQTILERDTITISSLRDRYTMPIFPKTVLKTISGDKRNGELHFQEYLFDFLDSYNFASVNKATIQQDSKTIINSSVLGLIFEKLNGYKDGSYFTPGYITMYMCREAITLAVVNKFNEKYSWGCNSLEDVYNNLEKNAKKLLEYNALINSIRLVDPAVGSGHFLVSALNEFINIKYELGILVDKQGKRLKDYKFFVENDELIILDDNDHVFSYLSPEKVSGAKRDELQQIQETIFNEKRTIIESCLFGVDINPKSVSISRLRLWIELLKFMYYKPNNEGTYELETLPNIDINIKTGNSLISRFSLNDEAGVTIRDAEIIPLYKKAVKNYKSIKNTVDKRKLLIEIENYKSNLKGMMLSKSISKLKLEDKKNELKSFIDQYSLFNFKSRKDEKEFSDKVNKFTEEIQNLEKEVEVLKKNPIYSNAFEWRFEFPEVLDDKGNFIGFDVVVGNPPYGAKYNEEAKIYFLNKYESSKTLTGIQKGSLDTFTLFIEKGINLIKNGNLHFIVPMSITSSDSMTGIQRILENCCSAIKISSFSNRPKPVFESAFVKTSMLLLRKDNLPCKLLETTKMYRQNTFSSLEYFLRSLAFINVIDIKLHGRYPKISFEIEREIFKKVTQTKTKLQNLVDINGHPIYYRAAGGRYFNVVTNYPTHSSAEKFINFKKEYSNSIGMILSSSLFWWYQQTITDCLNLKLYEIGAFGFPNRNMDKPLLKEIDNLYSEYLLDIERNAKVREAKTRTKIESFKEYKLVKSWQYLKKIDDIICQLYGLTNEEIDFIKNYEIEYRLRDEG